MSESFYGGRRGASFIISKSYPSIESLIRDFGNKECEVGYDEYAFIDNINSIDNGKIYRHSSINSTDNGAVYIGQILQSNNTVTEMPNFKVSSIDNILNKDTENKQSGEYTLSNNDIIPGKYIENGQERYNNNIKWATCTINENGKDLVYIGFKFPYTIIDFSVTPITIEEAQERKSLIERIDDKTHPFFQNWNLFIPSGKDGTSISNLRVIQANDTVEDYEDKVIDITNGTKILVYDIINNSVIGQEIKTYYIGKFNMLESIQMTKQGDLIFNYTSEQTNFEKVIKSITNIEINNGKIIFSYNTGEKQLIPFDFVTDIQINNETGKINILHSNEANNTENDFIYPVNINVNTGEEEGAGTQQINVEYNNGVIESISNPINYIMDTIVTSDNHLLFLYSSPAYREQLQQEGKIYPLEVNGRSDWADIGSIKDQSGLLIGTNYNTASNLSVFSNIDTTIAFLNKTYPSGLPDGKIVTVGYPTSNKDLYAFNYNYINNTYVGWYYLGNLSSGDGSGIMIAEDTEENLESFKTTSYGTIWFVEG